MMDFITIPLVVGTITFGIYKLFELFVCRRERINLIEKLSDKFSFSNMEAFELPDYSRSRFSFGALKAGCLLAGIGLGLLLGFIISRTCLPYNLDIWQYRELAGVIYGACVLLFGGASLITAFIIEMKLDKKKEK